MMSKRNLSIVLIVLALSVGLAMITAVDSITLSQHPQVSESKPMYDPWNYSITIKKDLPIYTEEEIKEIFAPVLKDEL